MEVDTELFTTEFNVSASGTGHDQDTEVAMAEEHYVELKFGRDMRRVYKPGLPFMGNVRSYFFTIASSQFIIIKPYSSRF